MNVRCPVCDFCCAPLFLAEHLIAGPSRCLPCYPVTKGHVECEDDWRTCWCGVGVWNRRSSEGEESLQAHLDEFGGAHAHYWDCLMGVKQHG